MASNFYVPTQARDSSAVQKLLKDGDLCDLAIRCPVMMMNELEKATKVIALIKHTVSEDYNGFSTTTDNNFEYGIFLYIDSNRPPKEPNLTLDDTLAINDQFTLNIQHTADKRSTKKLIKGMGNKSPPKDYVSVQLSNSEDKYILDIPKAISDSFFNHLKKAREFQNKAQCKWITNSYLNIFPMEKFEIAIEATEKLCTEDAWPNCEGGDDSALLDDDKFKMDHFGDTDCGERDAREKIKRTLIKERQSEYTTKSRIRVFCGTWNVNGQLPNEETYPLDAWLHLDEAADIYAIGFQELNLNVTAHIVNDPLKESKWKKYIEDFFLNNHVTKNIKFEMVSSIKLVGILLIVYAKKKLMSKITDIRQHSYATGIAGILGNKGGVAVGCKVYETSICFVNCHLAAHQEYFEERNKQFQYIYKRLELPPSRDSQYPETLLIDSYNTLFWLGDLNYRINETYDYVVELVNIDAENVYDTLRKSDQLFIQREAKNAFADFQEAEICFAPTYKYDPGTDRFDSSEKNRIPAYCDRVLYKSIAEINTSILSYNSHPSLKLSDHKPVSCLALTEVSEVDEKAYKRVYKDVQSTLDLRENEMLPKCILSCQEIDFASLVVGEEYKETLTLHNDGQLMFSYNFKDHFESKKCCPDWISIHPKTGNVPKGRKQIIEISVNVGYNHMTQFYEKYGKFDMEEVLILDLVKGSDKFITVKGELTPSAFGLSLDVLCRMNFRAVALESEKLKELKGEQLIIPVPKEIFLMVDALTKCLSQKGLFPKEPSSKRMQDVRLAIDTCDKPLLDYIKTEDPQAISSMLFVFLESLPNPIIDESRYRNFMQGYQQFALLKQAISNMREPNKSTFQYLIKFLALVVEKNSATVKELSQLFANCFLRKPKNLNLDISRDEEEKRKEKIIEYFIDKSRKKEY